jgi:hypothetical protein
MARPNPMRILRSVFSKDPDDSEKFEGITGPIISRVDFINNILAKEILEVIKEWNNCCTLSYIENNYIKFIKKHPNLLEYFFMNLTFVVMSVLSLAIFLDLTSGIDDSIVFTFGNLRFLIIWGVLSILGIGVINEIRKKIFSYSMQAFKKYGSRFLIFELTNGDKQKQIEIILKNSKSIKKFLYGSALNLILNIIGVILVYYLF